MVFAGLLKSSFMSRKLSGLSAITWSEVKQASKIISTSRPSSMLRSADSFPTDSVCTFTGREHSSKETIIWYGDSRRIIFLYFRVYSRKPY